MLADLTPEDREELAAILAALFPLPAGIATQILARVILDMAGAYYFDGSHWRKIRRA